jgi:predicted tellurium resistance membrane protein TerC
MDWIAPLLALTLMEIVLGIDNIVFIAVLSNRLPKDQQAIGRNGGLVLALVMRILLLIALKYVVDSLTGSLFELTDLGIDLGWFGIEQTAEAAAEATAEASSHGEAAHESGYDAVNRVTGKDLVMLLGGLFLLWKSVHEIHKKLEGEEGEHAVKEKVSLVGVLAQIALIDLVFSLDSVITAIGMAKDRWIMIVAIVVAILVMLVFSKAISRFIEKHPTVKMLALSFLLLIGVMLIAEGVGGHINKGYIYFAMAFGLLVEVLNLRMKASRQSKLRPAPAPGDVKHK